MTLQPPVLFFQQMSKKELLSSDFEGILKYFRVSLPKKYRNEDVARQLFKLATSIKVKKIKKYEKEYLALKGWFLAREVVAFDNVFRVIRRLSQRKVVWDVVQKNVVFCPDIFRSI